MSTPTHLIRSTSSTLTALLLGLGCLGLLGCEDKPTTADGGKKPAAAAAAVKKAKSAVEEAEEASHYTYNPIGKRDPFRSFIAGEREDEIRSPTPLQKYDVTDYRLVGIVWGVNAPRAMVEDPARAGHVIELGTYIGKNWGKVTQITSTEVVVTEEYQTIHGELVTNQLVMVLPVEDLMPVE